ncbi:MAG: HK97 family phage prohead protease [Methanolobus sp.]|jgi:hypothetical protein|nr:HK97 family phage prohead protease [Methanolobus sp.]
MKHKDLRREIKFRALPLEETNDQMILEGKAIVYGEKTKLFSFDNQDYFEVIEQGALKNADLSDVFLKYNHADNIMVMARTRNNTLFIEEREDGVYIKAFPANTTAGKDLYELVKRGDIDKMSFAFTEEEEHFDEETRTWTVKNIKKMYDVAAVTVPAYSNTELYARRKCDLEKRISDLEKLQAQRKRISILNSLGGK